MLLSIILPIRNEESILWKATIGFAKHFDEVVGPDQWQYVLVVNGSTDNSLDIAYQIAEKWPKTLVLNNKVANIGKAQRSGFLASEGIWSLFMNVDHLWDSAFFMWAWKHREEYQLILGSKRADPTINQQNDFRRFLSNGLNALLHFLFNFVGMETRGMKLLKTEALRPIAKDCVLRRGQFDTELTLKALRTGLWVAEVPMPYIEKRKPRNFMIKKILQNTWDLFFLYNVINKLPYNGYVRYRRFCREDMLNLFEIE